ncbi:hypothetical protein quinque_010928 [Culex quinquefasciatus]
MCMRTGRSPPFGYYTNTLSVENGLSLREVSVETTSYGVTEETLGKLCERRVPEEANFFELWRVVLLFLFLLGLLKKGLEEVTDSALSTSLASLQRTVMTE